LNAIDDAVRALLAADESLAPLGFDVVFAQAGTARVRLTPRPSSVNGHGIVHGGLVYALADTAFACAANSVLPGTVTTSASITYLVPAQAGEELVAEAVVRYALGRQSMVDVTVSSGDRVIAEYRGHGLARRERSAEALALDTSGG
jgi:acyl-CoA thioesterase